MPTWRSRGRETACLLVLGGACGEPAKPVTCATAPAAESDGGAALAMLAAMSPKASPDGPVDDDIPRGVAFDANTVRQALHRAAETARRECASFPPGGGGKPLVLLRDSHGAEGTEMFVSLRLARDGHVEVTHVASVLTEPDDRSPLGQCVRAAFAGARIPAYDAREDATLDWYADVWSTQRR